MHDRCKLAALALMAALAATIAPAQAQDAKYPDWSGQWRRGEGGQNQFDPSQPPGSAQEVPLTPEYQAIYEAGLKDQAEGGQGNNMTYACLPPGMPRMMTANQPIEFVVTPRITYVNFTGMMPRRIFTDGRSIPGDQEPTFAGYSVGKWIDEDGDRRYDVLEVETRHLKGPRTFDGNGHPLHQDSQTIVRERLFLDKANPDLMHNDLTTIDHALTRPYTVNKTYRRQKETNWIENICSVGNNHVLIGKEGYMLSADGFLMPAKKGQKPPDLRYFDQAQK